MPKKTEDDRTEEGAASEASAGGAEKERDPRAGSPVQRLATGFGYPFSGLIYTLKHPVLWSYTFLPVLVTACALALILYVILTWGPTVTRFLWTPGEEWYWLLLWYPLHIVLMVVLFAIGAVILPGLISSPFIKALSRRTEEIETKEKCRRGGRSFFRDLLGTLADELRKIGFLLIVHAVLLLIVIIPVAGPIVYPMVAWFWTVVWLSIQNIDFSLARHEHPFMQGPRLVRANLALFLGFGIAVFFFLLIPLFNFLFVPVAVVAATRLFLDLKAKGAIVTPPPKN